MAKDLSIRVKVKMPTQADLKRELSKSLKDNTAKINVKVHVTPDMNSLRTFRKQITEFTKGKPVKIRTELDAKGLTRQVQALNRQFRALKETANSAGRGLSKGMAQSAGLKGTKQQLQQINSKVKEIVRSEKEWRSLNTKVASGGMGEKQLAVTKRRMDELKTSIKSAHKELTTMTGSAKISNNLIAGVRGAARETQKFKTNLASAKNEEKQASTMAKQLAQSIKSEYGYQKQMLSAGTREKAILQEQLSLTRKQSNEIARQAKLESSATRQRAANATKIASIQARAADKEARAQQNATLRANRSSEKTLQGPKLNRTYDVFNMAQQGGYAVAAIISQMNEVDKAITSVTKVVDAPKAALDSFSKNIYKNASAVGKSASEYASAVEQWASAGYNLKQSTSLAKDSVMGAFVGNVDVNDMVKYMAVPLNAFRKQGLKSKDVINAMNEVANKNAIEMDDLGQAYSRAGASVASTGTNFSQLTGMVTAAQEGTRAGGDVIGRAIKTISINFSNMGNGLTKQNKVRSAYFKSLGVDLKGSNGQLKSTWEIMDKLAGKWKTMSKSDKQTASWYAAGKEQATQFQAMMDNWDTAQKAMKESQAQVSLTNKTQGSAFKEFAKQQDSMEFHIANLKNAWGQLLATITGGRSGLNGLIDAGTSLLNVFDKLANNKMFTSGLKVAGMVVGVHLAQKAATELIRTLARMSQIKLTGMISQFRAIPGALGRAKAEMKSITTTSLKMQAANAKLDRMQKASSLSNMLNGVGGGRKYQKIGQNSMGMLAGGFGSSLASISRVSNVATKASRGMGLLSKAFGIAKLAGRGFLAALGPIGVAIDVITLALGALKLMGIDPIKNMKNAAHASENALKAMGKELNNINNQNIKLGQTMSKNRVFNGQTAKDNATLNSMSSDFNKLTPKNNKIDDSAFQKIKSEYNSLAKANGIDLRIRFNNYDLIKAQLSNLKAQMKDVNRQKLDDGLHSLNKELTNMDKIGKQSNINKVLSKFAGSDYADKISQAYYTKDTLNQMASAHAGGQDGLNDKEYKRKVASIKADIADLESTQLRGTNLAKAWSSKQGQQVTEAWNNVSTNVRQQMKQLGQTINSGAFDMGDYYSMSKKQLQQMSVAQGQVVGQYGRESNMLKEINIDRATGRTLNQQELSFLASQGEGFENLSANTKNWSSTQIAAVSGLTKKYSENTAAAKKQLETILTASGMSSEKAEEAANAYAESGKSYVDMMTKQGKLGQSILGVTQEFMSAYGKNWKSALVDIQNDIDNIPDNIVTKYSFSDENGMVIPGIIDKINEIPKKKLTELGVLNKEGNFSVAQFTHGLDGIPKEKLVKAGIVNAQGSVDPVQFLKKVNDLKSNLPPEIRVKFLANTVGFNNKAKEAVLQMAKIDGTDATANMILNDKMFGSKSKEVSDWIRSLKGTEVDPEVNIKVTGQKSAKEAVQGVHDAVERLNGSADWQLKGDKGNVDAVVTAAMAELNTIKDKEVHFKGDKTDLDAKRQAAHNQLQQLHDKLVQINGKDDLTAKAIAAFLATDKIPKSKDTKMTASGDTSSASTAGTANADSYNSSFKKGTHGTKPEINDNSQDASDKGSRAGKSWWSSFKKAMSGGGVGVNQKTGQGVFKMPSWLKNLTGGNKTKIKISVTGSKDANVQQLVSLLKSVKKSGNKSIKISAKVSGTKKAGNLKKAIKGIKGKTAKIKATVTGVSKAKSLKTSIKGVKGKSVKLKVSVSGAGTAKSLKNSIKGVKGKSVKISAKVSGASKAKSLKSAISKVKGKSVRVKSSTTGTAAVKKLHSAIKTVKSKTVRVKAKVSGKSKVTSLRSAIGRLKGKTVHVKASVSGAKGVNALANAINRVHSKSVTVSTSKVTTITTKHKSGSVAIDSPVRARTADPTKSMSVVTGDPAVAPLVNEAARQMGIGVRDSSDAVDNTRVSEDYWRYMPKQLYTGQKLDNAMSKIEDAITQAGTDINKIIRLNQQKIALDQKQISYQNSLRGSYNSQMSSVLGQLRKYGFHTSGNQITNAGHAASFKGDKASKVDSLLSTYQSVYQSLGEIDTKISNLKSDMYTVKQTIAEQKDQQESTKIEKLQRQLELLTTSIDNSNAIYEKYGSYIGASDYRLKLQMDGSQLNSASSDIQRMINEFNKLSVMKFGNPEQAKKINDSLQTLKTSILSSVDTIESLRSEIQDLKISAITEDLNKFTTSLNGNVDKLKNNVTNLQDGLLSGTSFDDLQSSRFGVADLSQKTGLEQQAQDRLNLEKRLNEALDKFAQKNVDQTAKVANAQLQIERNKYAQLLNLAKSYASGYLGSVSGVKTTSVGSSRSDAVDIDNSRSTQYLAASKKYAEDMNKARQAYNKALKAAQTDEEKEAVNQKFILDQIDMQRDVYEEIIKADMAAIETLQNKLSKDDLTTEQRQKINDAIANYESEITNSQNSIKESVKSRFDYENQLITDQINKYKDYSDTLSNLVGIGKSLNLGNDVMNGLYEGQYNSQYAQYNATLNALSKLRGQQKGFAKGSYEYNLLEAEIKEYESGLSSIVTGLLDVTKTQFENTLDGVQEQIEKSVYGGKTANERDFENNLWLSGVDKELTLEAMRQKLDTAQLENETVNKQLAYLDGQKKMSKIESDRLDKQIDVLTAQQKLDAAVGNKNVQTIEKDENGKFQWKYVANQTDIDAAQEELNTAKKAEQDFLNQSKSDYITRVGEVISGAKDGSLTPEEVKQRLAEINDSYKNILKDIPGFDSGSVEGIIDAYNKYVAKNRDVIKDYGKDSVVGDTQTYQDIIKGFGESFKTVSKDLASIIGNELRNILTGTGVDSRGFTRTATTNDSVAIDTLNITLPNVENGEQFADYLRGFSAVAKQYAQGKA